MKKNLTNYAIKMMGFTIVAFAAMLKPAFCQKPAIDNDLITYSMAVSSNQQVKFRLPSDIRPGDRITGSVVEEKKNNTGEVNKASSRLEGVVIEIDGKQTKLSNRLFSFIVPAGIASLPFLLKNSAGEIIEQSQIPIGIYSYFDDRWQEPVGGLGAKFSPEAIAQPGQPLKVTGSFDGNAANTNISLNGQACESIAESPRANFTQVTQNATAGVTNISISENNVTEEHKINIATLNLTANKTNLLKGGKATVNVTINGLENLKAEKINYKLSLENLSPQTISFLKESGNVITKEINTGSIKNGTYEFSTRIIALTTGVFTVSANLTAPEKSDCQLTYEKEMASINDQEIEGKKRCDETKGSGLDDCLLKLDTIIKDLKNKCRDAYLACIKNK
jgi:hypothetical protein